MRNPVLLITCAIPAVAVLASLLTLAVAMRSPDAELPEQYHWEGLRLDRDFELARRAAEFEVRAELAIAPVNGAQSCTLVLASKAPAPDELALALTHATLPALDRRVTLRRDGADSGRARYSAPCEMPSEAHWRIELRDDEHAWSLRQNLRGSLAHVILEAAPHPGA